MDEQYLELRSYSVPQLLELFNIKKSYWNNNRGKCLEFFKNFCEYELVKDENDNRKVIIKVTELKTIEGKVESMRGFKMKNRQKAFSKAIVEVVKKDNLQTMRNISQEIQDKEEIKKFNYKDSTCENYTRGYIKEDLFGTIDKRANPATAVGYVEERLWGYKVDNNRFAPLTKEDMEMLYNLYREGIDEVNVLEFDLMGDVEEGEKTEKEVNKIVSVRKKNCFKNALMKFRNRKGYTPIRVSRYQLFGAAQQ